VRLYLTLLFKYRHYRTRKWAQEQQPPFPRPPVQPTDLSTASSGKAIS
jgi:hypothetical protein